MYPSFSKIFSQNYQRRFLVIGDVFLDDYLYGSVKKVSTGIKIPIVDQESSLLALGGAGNVAANIAGLSKHVSLIAQVGEDECGEQIRKLLDSKGICPLLLPTDKSIRKQRVYVDGQQIVRIDSGSRGSPDYIAQKRMIDETQCNVIVIADYLYGTVDQRVLDICKQKAKKESIPILMSSRRIYDYDLSGVQVVVANRDECEGLKDGRLVPSAGSGQALVVTKGEEGMTLLADGAETSFAALSKHPKNVSGAGDTVLAVLAFFQGSELSIREACEMANVAAALAVEDPLTYAISRERLLAGTFDASCRQNSAAKFVDADCGRIIAEAWKRAGRKIVFTNGCYDLLHLGHLHSLSEARKFGDKLVVGVNSDASIRRIKGDSRPVNKLAERVRALSYLETVDMIIAFEGDTAVDLLQMLQPDVYAKGEEYKDKELPEADFARKVEYIPMLDGFSTTGLLAKVAEARGVGGGK